MSALTCINCGKEVATKYCPDCGQRNPPKPINLMTMYQDFQSRVYGFDGMFPRTIRDLTLRPGEVARTFIAGNRVKYVGPVGYFFIMVTSFIIVMNLLGIDFFEYGSANNPVSNMEGAERSEGLTRYFMDQVRNNMRIFNFAMVPVTAFVTMLFFRKSGLNYLENHVLVFYTLGHIEWFGIANLLVYYFTGQSFVIIQGLIIYLYFGYGCMTLFTHNKKWVAFIKGIFASLIAYLLFMLIFIVGMVVYMILNPELAKSLINLPAPQP